MEKDKRGMTKRLADFITSVSVEDLPGDVIEHAKVAFLDWIGVLLAGKDEPLVHKLISHSELLGGRPQATILGHGLKRSVTQAAFINGAASHALDYDDTLRTFIGHPSVTLFPAFVACGEWMAMGGRELLLTYVTGIQVGAVIGASAGFDHYRAGWHATSTMGRIAAASGCAKMMGLAEDQVIHALGIAATQSSGLKRVFGTMCKPLNAGKAAEGGVEAALLASAGFTSAQDVLEGPDGFFQTLGGSPNEELLREMRSYWHVVDLSQKYHASCHFTHSPIEAALRALEGATHQPSQIKEVRVRVSKIAARTAGIESPGTALEGKFSMRYCIANAILTGQTGLMGFTDERVNDPSVRRFMERVMVMVDPELGEESWESTVEVELLSGEVLVGRADVSREIPPIEVKRKKIRSKFNQLSAPVLESQRAKRVEQVVLNLEDLEDIRELVDAIEAV